MATSSTLSCRGGLRQKRYAHPCDVIGEIGDLLRRHRAHHIGHGAVIAVAAVVLVLGERLGEIILALVGDARDVVGAGEIGLVAGIAAMLARRRLRALDARGIGGIIRRLRLRQCCDEIGEDAQIVVGQRLRHLIHRLERAQLLAEHEELDQRIGRVLAAERGRVLGRGLALLAVTGKAGRGALLDRFRAGGGCKKGDGQRGDCCCLCIGLSSSSLPERAKRRTRNPDLSDSGLLALRSQ